MDEFVAPTISLELKTPAFNYFWIKYVTGFDIRHHCAAGLRGVYSKMLPYKVSRKPFTLARPLDEAPFKFIYLCGNTGVWERNTHLALQPSPGEIVEYEDDYIVAVVTGMKRVPIEPIADDLGLGAKYMTCRNFQFGYQYLGGHEQWLAQQRQGKLHF